MSRTAAGLCCAVCTKRIVNRQQNSRWKQYLGFQGGNEAPSQAFDVDHIANLIFNDLFKLNSGGHGFLNTCVQCNQSFKGEKIWCPSINLWYHLLDRGYTHALVVVPGLTKDNFYKCYPWPMDKGFELKTKHIIIRQILERVLTCIVLKIGIIIQHFKVISKERKGWRERQQRQEKNIEKDKGFLQPEQKQTKRA